jgi:hypothetical protein
VSHCVLLTTTYVMYGFHGDSHASRSHNADGLRVTIFACGMRQQAKSY